MLVSHAVTIDCSYSCFLVTQKHFLRVINWKAGAKQAALSGIYHYGMVLLWYVYNQQCILQDRAGDRNIQIINFPSSNGV